MIHISGRCCGVRHERLGLSTGTMPTCPDVFHSWQRPNEFRSGINPVHRTHQYFDYILTNPPHSSLYIGVSSDLTTRMHQHRSGEIAGFASRYNLRYLVYFEETSEVNSAISREKQLKGWSRSKKERLINSFNAEWVDLSIELIGTPDPSTPSA